MVVTVIRMATALACAVMLTGVAAAEPAVEHGGAVQQQTHPSEPAPPVDVHQHLERIEQIVNTILEIGPPGEPITADEERIGDVPQRVGTTGTPVSARTGETVIVDRAKLEDLRVHVRQAREALRVLQRGERGDHGRPGS
jgi:hypothetical protein